MYSCRMDTGWRLPERAKQDSRMLWIDGKLLRKWSSGRKVLDCAYYWDGSLKSLTDASGKTTAYEYDGNGQLKYLKDENGEILTEYRYTKAGRLEEIWTAGGINTCYGYDGDGNLTHLTIGSKEEDTLLYDAFMLYDLNGNRIRKDGSRLDVDGEVREMVISYYYDSMNRLTEEDRNGEGEKYLYDRNGNRLKKEHYKNGIVDVAETYCYNERNELTSRKRENVLTSYLYDANGNLLSEKSEGKSSEYRYDLLNRTTFVSTLDGREQENRYDGEGLRAGLTENGKETAFVFHHREILTECDGESTPTRRHLLGIGLAHTQTLSDGDYHTYHQDEQGSTAYITGENRQTENIYHYDAFGNMLESRERTQNRIIYTGQQYDQETGQYYLRARYYNPVIGRFTQEDTYHGDGLNLYAYCANNPVVYYDPSGHKADCGGQAHNKTEQPKNAKDLGNRVVLPGDVDFVGPINDGSWTLTPNGAGAHLVEKSNVRGRSNLSIYDMPNTPRYYPYGSPESAGQAHIRLHEATRNQGIKLRGGNAGMSDADLLDNYRNAYNNTNLSGIHGDLRTPDGSSVIITDVTPGEAFDALMEWGNLNK